MDFSERRIEHLKMVQAVISRMAEASASTKRYAITLVTALLAFAGAAKRPEALLIAMAAAALFWLIDAQYLRQERLFRALYDGVRLEPDDQPVDFRMTPPREALERQTLLDVAASWSCAGVYGPVIGLVGILWVFYSV